MRKQFPLFLLLACALGFIMGLAYLFKVRFDAGDVYPPYSSLRADPLGTMALYESLGRTGGLTVRRDFSASNQMPQGNDTTYLHLAASPFAWRTMDEEETREIEGFVTGGGRLAVSFRPQTSTRRSSFSEEDSGDSPSNGENQSTPWKKGRSQKQNKKKSKRQEAEEKRVLKRTSLKERWGLEIAFVSLLPGKAGAFEPATVENQTSLPLPEIVAWHSGAIFTNLSAAWQTVYSRGTNPVLIERRLGKGTLVMATDSFFLSNEALNTDPEAALLSWWVGPSQQVVFDEAHFGIVENEGVAVLLRKYHLHGLAAALLLLAGLFIWKNSQAFLPAGESEDGRRYIVGKEASAGFVNLLRRNIPRREILDFCFKEWDRSQMQKRNPSKKARVEAALQAYHARSPRDQDPAAAYREIAGILKRP